MAEQISKAGKPETSRINGLERSKTDIIWEAYQKGDLTKEEYSGAIVGEVDRKLRAILREKGIKDFESPAY